MNSLKRVIDILTEIGIAVIDENGKYRNTYDVIQDIAKKWNA